LFPAFDSSEDAARVGGPEERFWIGVGLGDEAIDGVLEVVDRSEDATHQSAAPELG
jgi:hypothetical protein